VAPVCSCDPVETTEKAEETANNGEKKKRRLVGMRLM
jgi:hypothetical protein